MAINVLKPAQVSSFSFTRFIFSYHDSPSTIPCLLLPKIFAPDNTNIFRMRNIISISVLAGLAVAYSGDLTYYSAGLGSCGYTSTDGDAIVALSVPMVCIEQAPGALQSVSFLALCREQSKGLPANPYRWPTAAIRTAIPNADRRSAFTARLRARRSKPPWSTRAWDVQCTTLMSPVLSSTVLWEASRPEGCGWTGVRILSTYLSISLFLVALEILSC